MVVVPQRRKEEEERGLRKGKKKREKIYTVEMKFNYPTVQLCTNKKGSEVGS